MTTHQTSHHKKQASVWLTGASSGIGLELAKHLAKANYLVFVSARNASALHNLVEQHPNIIALPFDVSDQTQITSVREQIKQKTNTLDHIILNAGVCEYFDIDNPDWDMMRRVMDINYFGVINCLELALPLMPAGSQVVVVSSMVSFAAFPRAQAYGASKAALNYLMSAMKVDLAARAIDVTVVNPGFVDTPLTQKNDFPMPFLINTEQIAKVIVQSLTSRVSEINFPKKLSVLLKLANFSPSIWYKFIAPHLSRA